MHRRILSAFKNHNGLDHESGQSSPNGTATASLTSSVSGRSTDEGSYFQLDETPLELPDLIDDSRIDGAELATLVAQCGHAPATAWLESTRYRIWRPSEPVLQSSFLPVQGYLHSENWIFAWGAPLVSDRAALKPTLTQFAAWIKSHDLRIVYCCVPKEVEELLEDMGWSTVSCISEDIIDPLHVLEMTREDDNGGHGSKVKDLKKNLRRSERANVIVKHVLREEWTDDLKRRIEDGIIAWKRAREAGPQLASSSFDPWPDFENREYWVAYQNGTMVGVLILTPASNSYVIKNAVQFPDAPKGTSERLIHTVLRDLYEQHPGGVANHHPDNPPVTFNISAANKFTSTNVTGWKFKWFEKTYSQITRVANLVNRHDFRRKFDTSTRQMFVCYPSHNGFGKDGIDNLLKLLQR